MKYLSDKDTIKGVMDLLQEPETWIKGIRALSSDGRYIHATNSEAVKWCLGGAVMRVLNDQLEEWDWENSSLGHRLSALARARGYCSSEYPFVEFNNDPETTHEDLMLYLKEALVEVEG